MSCRSDGSVSPWARFSAEWYHVYYTCALGSVGANFAELKISWRPGGALFWCVREDVSREQLVGNRLDDKDLP